MIKKLFHIYIIDDDDKYRRSLVRLLAASGHSSESFSSAQSFLDSVPVDNMSGLLILDLRMPGMDGFALQKRVNELRISLQIIIITADAQSGDREQALREGAIGFLQKPFQEESLLELIKKAIKNTN